jgi:tetratricopeptide (TPR) repeat protein
MQYGRCIDFCERAIALEGDNYTPCLIKAYFLMGKALIDHTEYSKAVACLEKLVQLATDNDDSEVKVEA